jgi:hypothetical protein
MTGNTRRVPGKTGLGIRFQPRGEFAPAVFPIDEELRLPASDYTVAFWFRTTAPQTRLCEARRYSSYNNRWSDHVVSVDSGKLRFQLQGDAALEASPPVHDGHWHQAVTTVGPGGQKLYLDGQLVATGKLARRTRRSNRLGLDLGPGSAADGEVVMDEVRSTWRCRESR